VLHNTVIETAGATGSWSSIDYRFANTFVDIRNNLTRIITVRDGAQATLTANVQNVPMSWFVNPAGGDGHLTSVATGAINQAVASPLAGVDLDGQPHKPPPDIGADEYRSGR
jgi:hypothetical protein